MLKKAIKFKDLDDVQQTEEHYFNMTQAEVVELEVSVQGGLSALLTNVIKETNHTKIVEYIKKIILMSYGKRIDSTHFVKSEAISEEFYRSMAYDSLFNELMSDSEAAAAFVNGVLPKFEQK
jgi:hypothetical protein